MRFATDHLGHFALADGLDDVLARGGTRTGVAACALDPEAADRLREVSLLTLSARARLPRPLPAGTGARCCGSPAKVVLT